MPLRILILNYEYPPLGGGAGVVTQHLAEIFADRGHKVYIITTWFAGEPEFMVDGNLSIIRLPSRRKKTYQSNPWEMLSWIKHAIAHFREMPDEEGYDVCLANFTLPGGEVARYVKRKWGTPYFILSHGHDIPWFSPQQMFLWHLLCYNRIKSIMLESAGNILLTEELKALADQFLGEKLAGKNIVIPNGMPLDNFRRGFVGTPNSTMQVLFVGRLVEQKDPVTFIKACKIINDMNLPVHFTMIGDGSLKSTIEKLILKWNIQNIELLGKVSQSSVFKSYENAHVLVLPSREEAMALVLLEAVSGGVYTICTPVSGSEELIFPGINGDFIAHDNPEDIARKVADFYFEKYVKDFRYPEHIVSQLVKNFSWDKIADRYLDVFCSVVPSDPSLVSKE